MQIILQTIICEHFIATVTLNRSNKFMCNVPTIFMIFLSNVL